jgi:hypothetical protein
MRSDEIEVLMEIIFRVISSIKFAQETVSM